jgi:hypothetical protein
MKQPLLSWLIVLAIFSTTAKAQITTAFPNYSDKSILDQADSIKKELTSKGFTIIRESGLNMESQYDSPIVLQLAEGCWYHLVFIGDITSRLYEARMYDWEEKQVIFDQKRWGEIDGNILNYSYIPKFSEYHLLRLVQVNRLKKNLFGYAMIFKKTNEALKTDDNAENNTVKAL